MVHNFAEETDSLLQENKKKTLKKEKEKLITSIIWAIQFLNTLIIPVITTLIVYMYYKKKSNYITEVTKQALNSSFSIILYFAIGLAFARGGMYIEFELDLIFFIFLLLTLFIMTTAGILYWVCPILGIINTLKQKVYKPHYIIHFIK